MPDDRALRQSMVDGQLRPFDVTSQAVLSSILAIPRSEFFAPELGALAYADAALPVSAQSERRLLRPMVLGRMIQAADLQVGETVLDVAAGSGYGAAIMAKMGCKVTAVESDPAAVRMGRLQSGKFGFLLVEGAIDRPPAGFGPFNLVLVNGLIQIDPEPLLASLADGGRLLAICGNGAASFIRMTKRTGNEFGHFRIANATGPALKDFAKPAEFVF